MSGPDVPPEPDLQIPGHRSRQGIGMLLAAGLIAGLASWGAGEAALTAFAPRFTMSAELASKIQTSTREVARQKRVYVIQCSSVAYGLMGGLLGLAAGAIGGVLGASRSRARMAALIGLVLGLLAPVLVSYLLLPSYFRTWETSPDHLSHDITYPVLIHLALWAGVGIISGVALGLGLGSARMAVESGIGGLMGAALGTIVYDCLGGVIFPLDGTWEPMAHTMAPRAMAHLCVALMAAAGLCWSLRIWRQKVGFTAASA